MTTNVGLSIAQAIERGHAHEETCQRQLRVRVSTAWGAYEGGLTISATIAVRDQDELERNKAMRHVPWDVLDARALELVTLVDECVAEVETAFGLRRAA